MAALRIEMCVALQHLHNPKSVLLSAGYEQGGSLIEWLTGWLTIEGVERDGIHENNQFNL
ncbi:MAG: hypothetical protein JWQ04_53 [Pedosphaera sp.]|nr:hypothetical protein [Pedosphaera sp.]